MRKFVAAGKIAAAGGAEVVGAGARASSATETVDGLWIRARIDQRLGSLGVGDHTPVDLHLVLGTRPATPLAIEVDALYALLVASAGGAAGAATWDSSPSWCSPSSSSLCRGVRFGSRSAKRFRYRFPRS